MDCLRAEGLGATIQHSNPLIDQRVRDVWRVSSDWKLVAQMPFGENHGCVGREETFTVFWQIVGMWSSIEGDV